MKDRLVQAVQMLRGNSEAGRVVPPSGISAWLIVSCAAAMVFLAALAVLVVNMSDRAGDTWRGAIALSVTVRVDAAVTDHGTKQSALEAVFATSPGIRSARLVGADEQRAILDPVVGETLGSLSLPLLFALEMAPDGGDNLANLRLRLAAEVPEAVLDDPGPWRRGLVRAVAGVERLGRVSVGAVLLALVCVVGLASEAAIAANKRNIRTLRLIGATDAFIVRAFVRRITLRAAAGACIGVGLAGMAVVALGRGLDALLPMPGVLGWIWVLGLLPLVAAIAFVATRGAAVRSLRRVT